MADRAEPLTSIWQLRQGFYFSVMSSATWVVAMGSPLILLMEELGASSLQVGILYSFFFLLSPVQVLATALLPRLGFRRQMGIAWKLRIVGLSVPIALALYAPDKTEAWMPNAMLASMFVFSLFSSMGVCIYSVWVYALLPDRLRGKYFSTDMFMAGSTGLLVLFLCARINATMSGYEAFSIQFIMAACTASVAAYFVSRMPDATPPKPVPFGSILRKAPRLILSPGHYRKFLILWAATAIVATPFVPLSTYYLKAESPLSGSWILFSISFQYAGVILGSMLIRSMVDRFSVRLFFIAAVLANIVIYLMWIIMLAGWLPAKLIGIGFFISGISQANWYAAQMKYLPQLSTEEDRPVSVAVLLAAINVIAGMAPIAWGFFVRGQTEAPSMNLDHFFIYFAVAVVLNICLIPFFMRLVESRPGVETLYNPSWVSRPFRFIAALPYLITSSTLHDNRHDKGKN